MQLRGRYLWRLWRSARYYKLLLINMNTQKPGNGIFETRQHFEILDGLRGVAALSVVIFHFMEIVYTDYSKNFIGNGFLAVDFFFCLSGFVIAYAYDNRIEKIGIREFFKSRLIRLHPLVVLGTVLGVLALFFDPFGRQAGAYSAGKIVLLCLASLLLIPFPVMPDRAFNLFGFNAPAWSLFWEYVANIAYAFILSKMSKRFMLLLLLVAAALLCYTGYSAGNLMGGWGKDSFWDGGVRVAYSFSAGMLVYRMGLIIKTKLGFLSMAVLLALPFIMPWFSVNWLIEVFVVLFYFPLLVALGAGAQLSSRLRKICVFSGKISYPLYMTHYAIMWIWGNYYNSYKPDTGQLFLIITPAVLLLTGFAYIVMKWYDEPVRKYLTKKRCKG